MKILIACEFSGIVTKAFRDREHEAYSCDLLLTEGNPERHIQDDVLNHLDDGWDMLIAFPPCTHLAVSGARWFREKIADGRQQKAIDFFMKFVNADIPKIAIENPIGIMSRIYRKPDQIIQPWQFGHEAQKATCLWLKNLPKLVPTNIVDKGLIYVDPRGNSHGGVHTIRAKRAYSPMMFLPNTEKRWMIRSRTFQGIADAMSSQWG